MSGDSDLLFCDFLLSEGLVTSAVAAQSLEIAERYSAGTISPPEYCHFFASIVAGRSVTALEPVRRRFLAEAIRPRIPTAARTLLQRHRDAGDTIVLTTATNRAVSEFTAADLGVDDYLCTELEIVDGCYTGRTAGELNMGSGKLRRLRQWLADKGWPEQLLKRTTFYSDSINDLALLSAVGFPVVVDPDPRLESTALRKGWSLVRLDRRP
jgi:HAD superfamily hydrolase (TIGR01490 family)